MRRIITALLAAVLSFTALPVSADESVTNVTPVCDEHGQWGVLVTVTAEDTPVTVQPAVVTNLVLSPGESYNSTLDIVAVRRMQADNVQSLSVNGITVTSPDCVPTCYEDEPCWNCETMGNKICGPVTTTTAQPYEPDPGYEVPVAEPATPIEAMPEGMTG